MSVPVIVVWCLTIYGVIGAAVAVAFAAFGVAKVLPESPSMTLGARLAIIPGALVLWPYVLARWLKDGCAHCYPGRGS